MSHLHRRDFLRHASIGFTLGAMGGLRAAIPAFSQWSQSNERSLLVLQLSGGNDGLSTVVPYADPIYQKVRSRTRISESEVHRISDHLGFHPNLGGLFRLYNEGMVTVLPSVGYDQPDRSHFKSLEIWHAADPRGKARGSGWLGRLCEQRWPDEQNPALSIHVGPRPTYALQSLKHPPLSFTAPESYKWVGLPRESEALKSAAPICEHGSPSMEENPPENGRDRALRQLRETLAEATASSVDVRHAARDFAPKVVWPSTPLAANLATVCALASSSIGTRIYSVEMGGFDTHNNQRARHDQLMTQLDGALTAFQGELAARGLADQMTVLVFSEFGRRVQENGSAGTDHGAAGPVFLLGKNLKGGVLGGPQDLAKLHRGDLIHNTDFREIYGSLAAHWLKADAKIVSGAHAPLALFRG